MKNMERQQEQHWGQTEDEMNEMVSHIRVIHSVLKDITTSVPQLVGPDPNVGNEGKLCPGGGRLKKAKM